MSINSKPVAIYLESSIFNPHSPDSILCDSASFKELKNFCEMLDILLVINEVSIRENINNFVDKSMNTLSKISDEKKKIASKLSILELPDEPEMTKPPNKRELIHLVDFKFRENLNKLGVQIISLPDIDKSALDELINMGIQKILPFEERGEKGFRDAITLLSIVKHMKSIKKGDCILITKDGNYIDEQITKKHGVNLEIFNSIYETIEGLKQFTNQETRKYKELQINKIEDLLNGEKNNILQFIRQNADFSETNLKYGRDDGSIRGEIKEIIGINIVRFKNITPPSLGKNEYVGKISFYANLELDVVTKIYRDLLSINTNNLKKYLKADGTTIYKEVIPPTVPNVQKIERSVKIDGTIKLEDKEFVNLELHEVSAEASLLEELFNF